MGCKQTLAVLGISMVLGAWFGFSVIKPRPSEFDAQPLDLGIDLSQETAFVLDEIAQDDALEEEDTAF